MPHAPTGPLAHVVEQLWAPALATGGARLRVGGPRSSDQRDAAWRDVERYLVLPSLDRATMLLPRQPRRATAGALRNYRGLRRLLPNVQRTLMGTLAGAGVPLPFPRLTVQVRRDDSTAVPPTLPLSMLARQLELPEAFASIGVRTGANRKATLQLVDAAGTPRGFAKMAWGPASDEGVRLEAAALRAPLTSGPARTPRLVAEGSYYGHPYVVTAPLPMGCRGVRADVPAPTPQELFALCPLVRTDRVEGTGQLRDLRARVAGATPDAAGGPVLAAVSDLLGVVEQARAELPVTSRWHGDLTPWNSARDEDGNLWCWDWESSETDAVAGLDALHWHVTVATEGGRPLGGGVLTDAHQRAHSHLFAAGMPRSVHGLVTALYAATLAERACGWAAGGGGWERGWVLPHQLVDLLAAAGPWRRVRCGRDEGGTPRRTPGRGVGLLLLTSVVAGCAANPVGLQPGRPTATPTLQVVGLPEDPAVLLEASETSPQIRQVGSADVRIRVVNLSDGVVRVADGRGGGTALDFPAYQGDAAAYPRAAVTVSNAGPDDQLNPGSRDFVWGGDFRIDKISLGPGVDNGDNLVQRGISGQATLFKAEIDKDRAACTVRGDAGELIVRTGERVTPGWWYRVRCERTLNQLGVFVTEYHPDGSVSTYARQVTGRTGDVTLADPSTPLTVGGKVGEDMGLLDQATDQFNGLVMNPYYALGTG